MNKTVFILHGCPSDEERAMDPARRTYDKHWMPWLETQLIVRNYEVKRPHMPTPWAPEYDAFKAEFEKNTIAENDILVGHSCGAAFLVRWLGDTKRKAGKLILVAPWKVADPNDSVRKEYYGYEIDPTISERVHDIVIFTADDEEEAGKESARLFQAVLGAKMIELPGHGHYTLDDMGTEEFPELLAEIS